MNAGSLSRDNTIVNYENFDEREDSKLQVLFSNVIGKGNYKNPSNYKEVHALLLCWEEKSGDLIVKPEVEGLKRVLEESFRYKAQIEYLDSSIAQKLQVRVNRLVAQFVDEHDGSNNLLIVYYAGHGRPGGSYGSLVLHAQASPNDKKHLDSLVWNKTEELLKPAEAHILEIFDCCYAGNLTLTRGDQKLFEYLAATKEMATTPIPGENSFTLALIYALEALVQEMPEGRFTTDELLRKIKKDAPNFPKGQTPVLSDRQQERPAGRIMLYPLPMEGSSPGTPLKEASDEDLANQQILTLHFDFGGKPLPEQVELFGTELNQVFERSTLGVNGIRWGGMQSRAALQIKTAKTFLQRVRRASENRRRLSPIDTSRSDGQRSLDFLAPVTPFSSSPNSPLIQIHDDSDAPPLSLAFLPKSIESTEGPENAMD